RAWSNCLATESDRDSRCDLLNEPSPSATRWSCDSWWPVWFLLPPPAPRSLLLRCSRGSSAPSAESSAPRPQLPPAPFLVSRVEIGEQLAGVRVAVVRVLRETLHHDAAVGADQDVVGFQIAMDDSLVVGERQRGRDVAREAHDVGLRQRALARDPRAERVGAKIHREVDVFAGLRDRANADDVGMF